jgi:hypothetical protein
VATNLPPAPARKKTNPLVWVLVAVGVLILLFGIALVAGGFFLYYKARQAGLDPDLWRRNPGVAAAKLIAATNPDAEVVSVDENKGIVKIREKSTGKLYAFNFEDIKRGRITFTGEKGEAAGVPSWVPVYTGATPKSALPDEAEGARGAAYAFETSSSVATVAAFYKSALEKEGFQVKAEDAPGIHVLTATNDEVSRNVSVTLTSSGGNTAAVVRYSGER